MSPRNDEAAVGVGNVKNTMVCVARVRTENTHGNGYVYGDTTFVRVHQSFEYIYIRGRGDWMYIYTGSTAAMLYYSQLDDYKQ